MWEQAADILQSVVRAGALTPVEARRLQREAARVAMETMDASEKMVVQRAIHKLGNILRPVSGGDGIAEDVVIAVAQYLAKSRKEKQP